MKKFRCLLVCLFALWLAVLPALAETASAATDAPLTEADMATEGTSEIDAFSDFVQNEELDKQIMDILYMEDEQRQKRYYQALVGYQGMAYALTDTMRLTVYDGTDMQSLRLIGANGEEEEPQYIPSLLMEGDDGLYLLHRQTGQVDKIMLSADSYSFSPIAHLDWASMRYEQDGYEGTRYICSGTVRDGKVYLLAQNDDYTNGLYWFDLTTGTQDVLAMPSEYVTDAKPYRDGLVLQAFNGLYYLNLQKEEISTLSSLYDATGMAIDQAGHLYVHAHGEIYSDRENGTLQVVGYIGNSDLYYESRCAAVYGDYGYVFFKGESGVGLVDTAPGTMPAFTLRVVNNNANLDTAIQAFNERYPGIPVIVDDSVYMETAQDIAAHMLGADAADLYGLSLDYISLTDMARKDYLLPLSMDDYAARLNEDIRAVCMYNDTLYAVPNYTHAYTYAYNIKTFQKVGLTAADAPNTYSDMLDFIQRWQNELAEEYPEISLFEGMAWTDMKREMLEGMLKYRELQCRVSGETLSYQDADLQATLEKLTQTDFFGFYDPNNPPTEDDVGGYYYDDDGTPNALFSTYYSLQPGMYFSRQGWQPMPLTLAEDDPKLVFQHVYVMGINPAGEHQEEALALLRCIAEHGDAVQRIIMMPDENEPVENAWAVQALTEYERILTELKAFQDTLSKETDKKYVQMVMDDYEQSYKDYQSYRYTASAEDIAAFRAMDIQLVPSFVSAFMQSEELTSLIARMRDGAMEVRTFVNELERKVQMRLLEGE